MKPLFWIFILLLIVLHQDYWQWGRSDLLFGFLPYPLAYHMVISIVTAAFWISAMKFFWPAGVDDIEQVGLTSKAGKDSDLPTSGVNK